MSAPSDIREALIAEAIGDVGRMMQDLGMLASLVEESRDGLLQAKNELHSSLAGFEGQVKAITDHAKSKAVQFIAARTGEATRQSIDQQSQAMADAARIAFGAEVGAMMQRWQAASRQLLDEQRARVWEAWVTHAAAAVLGSAATWAVMTYMVH